MAISCAEVQYYSHHYSAGKTDLWKILSFLTVLYNKTTIVTPLVFLALKT